MSDKTSVTVPFERIQRVIDILSMVSIGEYTADLIRIPSSEQADEFSVLEAALNIYNEELASARAQNERYIAEMEQSKRELQEQLNTIARQQLAIHELSSPIAEVWEDILLLPVIGTLDSQRALEMTEKLLDRIKESRSRCVIIDITGVELVDTSTANAVLKMTRAARLLGANCVLTGVRPEIAQTMVQLNIDMENVRTLRTLKDGLRACFETLRKVRDQRLARRGITGKTSGNALSLLPAEASLKAPSSNAEASRPAAPSDSDSGPIGEQPRPLSAFLTSSGTG
jgi:rsbT co-antagonist protein RsbR